MALPQTSDALGNVLRLQGLKNVRKKVLPGAEFLENLNAVDTDVAGTGSDMGATSANIPDLEMGSELSPQSYDVRANQVLPQEASPYPMESEQPQEESLWTRFGRALAMHSQAGRIPSEVSPQTPPIETQQVEASEGLPPVSASQEVAEEQPSALSRFGTWFKKGWTPGTPEEIAENTKRMPPTDLLSVPPILENTLGLGGLLLPDTFGSAEKQQEWRDYNEDEALRSQGLDPQVARAEKAEEMIQDVQKAMEQPWEHVAYGASEIMAEHPALKEKFQTLTGVNYDDQIQEQVGQYEGALKGVEDALQGIQTSLGGQAEEIKNRILSNQATDMDKYYIGLALALPLIIGGFFGKEAALGALGGTAQGIADIYTRRGKDTREDEGTLLDIAKQRAGNEEKLADLKLKKAQLPAEIRKNLPADPNAEILGREGISYIDPETNQKVQGVEIAPGLIAKDKYLRSKKSVENMEKAAGELTDVKSYVDELDDLTNDVIYIASQLKDKDSIPKIFNSIVNKTTPGALAKLTEEVELDGRMVNAGLILQEKLGFIANAYAQAKQLGQLDRAAQSHIEKIMLNPTASLASNRDAIDQMLEVRKLAQRGLVKSAKNKGFVPEFLMKEFDDKNKMLYDRLNKGQQAKRLEEIKQKTARSGTTYAK